MFSGAKSKTAEQMSDVLKFNKVHPDHLHSSFSELRKVLVGGDTYALHVANKLYGHQGYNFLDSFLGATRYIFISFGYIVEKLCIFNKD